jgi:hypothetical protein
MSLNAPVIKSFFQYSFVVLPRLLTARERAALRQAADTILASSRAQSTQTAHSTPRISLLGEASALEQGETVLAPILDFATSPRTCALLRTVTPSDSAALPELKDMHYYHEQTKHDWDGDWHRDSQFATTDPEQERQLVDSGWSVHLRVALEDDDRLEVVPGSHARWDTAEEMTIRRGSNRATDRMPNALRVVLKAGDGCIFHAWSIHRATYRRTPIRRTLDLLFTSPRDINLHRRRQ